MINNYTAHPWHGISSGPNVPELVTAFIEIVPTDTVKYEIDKESGYLKLTGHKNIQTYCPVCMVLFRELFADN